MDGLLAKAKILKNRIMLLPKSTTQADFSADKEAEIMAEMNSILEKGRLEITETILSFSARSSGVMFPLAINIGAFTLLLLLGIFFFLRLNQAEVSLVNRETQLGSAEGLIIAALREASEEELSRKESQIDSIQVMLRETEQSKASLIEEFGKERSQMQTRLRDELGLELETERQRLVASGLGEAAVSARLAAFEVQKKNEYEARLSAINADFDKQLEERSALFNDQMTEYRRSLVQAQLEQESIQRGLEQQLVKARLESTRTLETMSAEKATAIEKLVNLGQKQDNANLVESRILSMYDKVNSSLKQRNYTGALAELNRLEEFLGSFEAMRITAVAERRKTEQFLIDSLRRLIDSELALETPKVQTNDPATLAQSLLESITNRVEAGNRLYAEGKLEAAKIEYTAALTRIPELDKGYSRLQELASRKVAQEKALLERQLAEGAALYKNNQYQASVDRYRQALLLIENNSPMVSMMLNHVLDAGYQIRRATEPPPTPVIIREELSEEDKSLVRRAQTAESQRRLLLEALDRLKTQYGMGSGKASQSTSQESMVMLLNAKMLLRRALSDREIREKFPELYKTLDEVFESYGEEQRTMGRSQALQDIVSLTAYLNSPVDDNRRPSLTTANETRQRKLLLEFLENLQRLLGEDSE